MVEQQRRWEAESTIEGVKIDVNKEKFKTNSHREQTRILNTDDNTISSYCCAGQEFHLADSMLDRESPITLSKGNENPERRRVTRKDCPVNSGESLSTVSVEDTNLVVFSEDIHEKVNLGGRKTD